MKLTNELFPLKFRLTIDINGLGGVKFIKWLLPGSSVKYIIGADVDQLGLDTFGSRSNVASSIGIYLVCHILLALRAVNVSVSSGVYNHIRLQTLEHKIALLCVRNIKFPLAQTMYFVP
ncbi:hypothetical protein D3C81_1235060 [compost metagenome]